MSEDTDALDVVHECSVEGFDKAFKGLDKAIAVYTQPGCPHCKTTLDVLKTVSDKTSVPLAEIDLADQECVRLADVHEIASTPTILLINKGAILEKFTPSGMTLKQIGEYVQDKLAKMPPPAKDEDLKEKVSDALARLENLEPFSSEPSEGSPPTP